MEILRRLEEVGRAVPQNCSETKLELIQHYRRQISELQAVNNRNQLQISHLNAENHEQLQQIDHLRTENQVQASELEELKVVQQQELEVHHREIEKLSDQLRLLELQPQEEGSRGSRQRDVSVTSLKKVGPSSACTTTGWLYIHAWLSLI